VVRQLALRTAPLASGARVGGRFRVQSIAQRTGMSTVYRAEDIRNQGVTVALKEFNATDLPAPERAEALAWLAREAGLLSTLAHPRLPKLIAAFSEGDRHYIVMPFLQGVTLEELINRQGPQPESLMLSWAHSLADLLTYLHTQHPPVLHRDLKPANVLLEQDGKLTLLDLGVARPLMRGVPSTAVGTPGYAPPEQYQGLADERSDIYALGATIHRALTGYDAEHQAPFRQPPLRDLNPNVSAETAAIVGDLLCLPPARRPARAADVAASIATTLRDVYTRPMALMYHQMLILLVLGVAAGLALYQWLIGSQATSVVDLGFMDSSDLPAGFSYLPADHAGAVLRVLLVFAPVLLCFLPLFHPQVRRLAQHDTTLRIYRMRAAWLLLSLWLLPVSVWLADLTIMPIPGARWVIAPGQILLATPLAIGCAILVAIFLLRQYGRIHRLRLSIPRLRWYHLVLRTGGLFLLWAGILIVQDFVVHPW
jgi:hypothetical protein